MLQCTPSQARQRNWASCSRSSRAPKNEAAAVPAGGSHRGRTTPVLGADAERREAEVGGGVEAEVHAATAARQVDVGDYEGAVLVEDVPELVPPVGVRQGNAALLVACNLEALVAALRRVRAGEPERVGDGEVPAERRRAG